MSELCGADTNQLTRQHVMNCEFSQWYPLFKDVTFKSHIIELPNQFLEWLKTDGLSLPSNTPTSIFCTNKDECDSDDDGEDIAHQPEMLHDFQFDELNKQVSDAIENLGGHVFPKTNWSAPQVYMHVFFIFL